MGSEAEAKSAFGRKRRQKVVSYVVVLLVIFGIIFLEEQDNNDELSFSLKNTSTNTKIDSKDVGKSLSALEESCTKISFSSSKEKGDSLNNSNVGDSKWTTKPLWLPSYPSALEEATHKSIINTLTGLSAGGKSFYASSKATKLRQCFGQTETATCSNIHPIVAMSKTGSPEMKKDLFFPQYIMAIRNPSTAMPAFHNSKAIKYHGLKGQVPLDQWRQHRDMYFKEMLEEWKSILETWKGMEPYQVGLYLVYEHLWDVHEGPSLLVRLSKLLEKAGFSTILKKKDTMTKNDNNASTTTTTTTTLSSSSASCIWYKTMTRESIEKYHQQHNYEYYTDYIPGYTKEQQHFLMQELSDLMVKYKDDLELVSILTEYRDNIQLDLGREQKNDKTKT